MKRSVAATAAASLLALALGACASSPATTNAGSGPTSAPTEGEQVANPWVDCATLEDAAKVAGLELTAPDAIDGYSGHTIQAMGDGMVQIIYGDPDVEDDPLVYVRKSVGEGEDVSGDYNEYAQSDTLDVDGVEVSVRGNDGAWNDATWSRDGYSYSIHATDGLDASAVIELVGQVA